MLNSKISQTDWDEKTITLLPCIFSYKSTFIFLIFCHILWPHISNEKYCVVYQRIRFFSWTFHQKLEVHCMHLPNPSTLEMINF